MLAGLSQFHYNMTHPFPSMHISYKKLRLVLFIPNSRSNISSILNHIRIGRQVHISPKNLNPFLQCIHTPTQRFHPLPIVHPFQELAQSC